ncbi:MAG: hypothetical protein K2N51_19230 [Lachnospiraceae bacterium]|nr:hypothetical protein [Lachnospiraceae bacterium]
MSKLIYVDPALMEGGELRTALFVKEINKSWVIQSENPKTRNIDEYEQLSKDKVLEMYPELDELLNMELDDTISFRKGINSGKWYDFH